MNQLISGFVFSFLRTTFIDEFAGEEQEHISLWDIST